MASSLTRNVEYEVLHWATDKLEKAFRSSAKSLAGRFYAQKLLTTEVKRACSEGNGQESCVEAMVTNLQDRVSNDPKAYYNILEIIESEPGVSYITKHLEDKRSEIIEKYEEERKKEIERRSAIQKELEATHPQESSILGSGMGAYGRPKQLPTFTTAAPTMNSYTAPMRNAIAPVFHTSTGPAAYSKAFPPTKPFSKQQASSSNSLAGDTFPLQASSPGYTQKRSQPSDFTVLPVTTIPAQRKQSECKLDTLDGRLANMHLVTGMTSQMQLPRMQDHSFNMEAKITESMGIRRQEGTNHDQESQGDHARPEPDDVKEDNKKDGNHEGSRGLEEKVDSATKEEELDFQSGSDKEQTKFMLGTCRSNSISSNGSEIYKSFESASASLTSSIDSRGSPQHRRRKCNVCHFYKKELEKLENKVSTLEHNNKELMSKLTIQEDHSTQQTVMFREELSKREQMLTASEHRHQEMKRKMQWLHSKIAELENTTITSLVMEIEVLKKERDRERHEKEKERLQKEKECIEKEKERLLFEREREQSLSLEKQLSEVRILLIRTKSLQCEEQEAIMWDAELTVTDEAYNFTACQQRFSYNTDVPHVPGQREVNIDQRVPTGAPNLAAGQWRATNTMINPAAGQWSAPNTMINPAAGQWSVPNTMINPTAGQWSTPNTTINPVAGHWGAPNTTINPVAGHWGVPNNRTDPVGEQWNAPDSGTNLVLGQQSAQNTRRNPAAGERSAANTRTNPEARQWCPPNFGPDLAAGQRSTTSSGGANQATE